MAHIKESLENYYVAYSNNIVLDFYIMSETIFILLNLNFFFFNFLAKPRGMLNLNSLTRDQTCVPTVEGWSTNHWTTREVSY